jgi:hypothetical protein
VLILRDRTLMLVELTCYEVRRSRANGVNTMT